MANKLTRCLCGKIFDPAEGANCPACGAAPRNEAPLQKPADASSTDLPLRADTSSSRIIPKRTEGSGDKREFHLSISAEHLVRIAIACVMIVAAVGGTVWFLRKPSGDTPGGGSAKVEDSKKKSDEEKKGGSAGGKIASDDTPKIDPKLQPTPEPKIDPDPKPKPTPDPTPALDPAVPKIWIVDAQDAQGADGTELAAIIAKTRDGDTVTLRPGTYFGGFKVDKKIRITGDATGGEKPAIKAVGTEGRIRVTAKGVVFANLQIVQDKPDSSPALMLEKDSETTLENCEGKFNSPSGIGGKAPASITATKCAFSSDSGSTMLVRGPSQIKFTDCTFTGGARALMCDNGVEVDLHGCKFQNIGTKAEKTAALCIFGGGSRITAEDCTFTEMRLPIEAEKNATISLTKCTFTGNGVPGDAGDFTQGIIALKDKASATLTDVIFEKNMQGVNLFTGGTAQLTGCKFTDCGTDGGDAGVAPFCASVRVHGTDAKATVSGCTFTRSNPYAIFLAAGGSASVEDSEFANTKVTAIEVGGDAPAQGRITARKSRFHNNVVGASLRGGMGAMFDDCEFRENVFALIATEPGTKLEVSGGVIAKIADIGCQVLSDATLTISGVKFAENKRAILVGASGKPAEKAAAAIEDCKFSGSTDADVLACVQSKVTIRLCEFDAVAHAKVQRENGADIQSEPPLMGIVDVKSATPSKDTPGKDTPGTDTPGKGGSTASNTKGTSSKGRSSSSPRRPPQDPVRDIINAVDKMKHIFR